MRTESVASSTASRLHVGRRAGCVMAAVLVAAASSGAQLPVVSEMPANSHLPFSVGEQLNYRIRVSFGGEVGRGSMWIEGPADIRGVPTLLLRSDFRGKMGPINGYDRSDSWFDPARMAAMRFAKSEKQMFSKKSDSVEIFPGERRWEKAKGEGGVSVTDAPLDELSFIYYIRTLDLSPDSAYTSDRHYDVLRNPVSIRVVGRETVVTPAGTFATVVVEMRVKDARRVKNDGLIKLWLTDDHCRLPVRIEGAAPVLGTAVFTLESYTRGMAAVVVVAGGR
jgi:hypothetical protein